MDAFFTIATVVPVEEPSTENVFVNEETGGGSSHGSCTIA